jgi:uncharacterized protein
MDIFQAIRNSDIDLVDGLIKSGVKINQQDFGGDTPLGIAASGNDYEMVKKLLDSGAKIDAKSKEKLTPLQYAIRWKANKVVYLLIDRGANINAKDIKGNTILMEAVLKCDHKVIKKILSRNPDVNTMNKAGSKAINRAVTMGMLEITKILLEDHKAEIDESIFFHAIGSEKIDILDYFIKHGLDINKPKTTQGMSLLMCAVFSNYTQVSKFLVDSCADLNVIDNYGMTALDYAKQNKNNALAKYIVKASKK